MECSCGIGGRALKVDLVSYLAMEEWLNCGKIDDVETNFWESLSQHYSLRQLINIKFWKEDG